jgi:multiple sugar transport system substrate-binding protein
MNTRSFSRRQMLRTTGAATVAAAASPLLLNAHAAPATSLRAQELEPAELTFYFGANPEEAATRQLIIDAFMEKYPQITITPQIVEGNATQEIQIQFAGGASPDILMAWELDYSGLATRGVYHDLNEFIQNDPDFAEVVENDHIPELVGMFNWEGAQYVLPEQFAGVALYYNTAHFEEAGIEPPPADWTDASWNWDRLLETAQALTVEEENRYGFVDAWWPPLSAAVIGTGNGGAWFDQYVNPSASTITDPNFTTAVQWYADLANVHAVAPTPEELAGEDFAGPGMFQAGRASMALVGHWMYPAFSTTDGLEFEVGVLPVGPDGSTPKTDLGSTGLAISTQTEYPEHAWEFVKFSTGPEGQQLIAESGLFVPVLRSLAESDTYLDAHAAIENAAVFTTGIENAVELPITPVWNEIAAVWARETDRILRGEATAEEVHAALETEINDLLG